MPYWSRQDEERLRNLASKESVRNIALFLKRSPKAVKMKLKRMGIAIPEKSLRQRKTPQDDALSRSDVI